MVDPTHVIPQHSSQHYKLLPHHAPPYTYRHTTLLSCHPHNSILPFTVLHPAAHTHNTPTLIYLYTTLPYHPGHDVPPLHLHQLHYSSIISTAHHIILPSFQHTTAALQHTTSATPPPHGHQRHLPSHIRALINSLCTMAAAVMAECTKN